MDGEFAVPALPIDDDEEEDEEEEEEGDIDEELAAELAREMGEEADEDGTESDESDESSNEEDEDEDEDEDDEEVVQAKKLLLEEIRDLEAAVARKETEIRSSVNPLIKVRFWAEHPDTLTSCVLLNRNASRTS